MYSQINSKVAYHDNAFNNFLLVDQAIWKTLSKRF